jgi:hypothetical protein
MIPFLANPLIKLLAGKVVKKIATELIETQSECTPEENEEKVNEVIKKHLPPFWKQRSFYIIILIIFGLIVNQLFGWEIPLDSLIHAL